MTWAILRMQVWELWRLTRLELLLRFLLPLLFLWLLSLLPGGIMILGAGFTFEIVLIVSITSTLWVRCFRQRGAVGFPFTLSFSQPVPASRVVFVPLGWLLLTNALLYLALVGASRIVFHVVYPGLAMVPVVVLASIAIATLAWAARRLAERVVAAVAFGALALWWLAPRVGQLDPLSLLPVALEDAFQITGMEYGVMAGATVLIGGMCLYFIRQQRCGERGGLFRGRGMSAGIDRFTLERTSAFRTPREAQVWFELRRAVPRSLAIVLVGLCTMLAAGLALAGGGELSAVALLWPTSLCLTPLALLFCTVESVLGVKYRGQVALLSVYEATQPVAVAESIRLKLGVILRITLAGFAIFAVGALCGALVFFVSIDDLGSVLADVADANGLAVALWIGCGLALFAAVCAAAALWTMSLGYGSSVLADKKAPLAIVTAVLLLPGVIQVIEGLTGWDLRMVTGLCYLVSGGTLIGVTLMGFRSAVRAGFLSMGQSIGALGGWISLLALLLMLALDTGAEIPTLTFQEVVFAVGLLCIPVASVAWAPLSLGAARNQ